jgi:hypothetical protein
MTKQMRSIEIEITEIIIYFSVLIWELNRLRSQLLFCLIIYYYYYCKADSQVNNPITSQLKKISY